MASATAELMVKVSANTADFESKMKHVSGVMTKAGAGMMAAGMAVVGAFGMMAKAAEDERINIAKLANTLDNVGVSYDSVKESLEAVILATQRKTGIADDQQREALSQLIITTGDYKRSLELLPLVLDLAAAKSMDLGTAAEVVGRVAQGNTTILTRYGIQLKEGATTAEALAEMQDRVSGSAEAMASPIEILKASFSDMQEAIGAAVSGPMIGFVDKATSIIDKVTDWAGKNEELVRQIMVGGVVMTAIGGLLIALSMVAKAIMAVNAALAIMHGLSGVGWVKLAAGIVAAGAAIAGMSALVNKSMGTLTVPEMPPLPEPQMPTPKVATETIPEEGRPMTPEELAKYAAKVRRLTSYQYGGIVPGPIGQPRLIEAHGGEVFAGVGNKFGAEVHVHVGNLIGDETSMRKFLRMASEILGEEGRRNTFGQVNQGYYYGRSSV